MTLPKVDPKFTMKDLEKVGVEFLAAGSKYWEASHKAGIQGAVIWLTDTDGAMVMYTRGEYRQRILNNIDGIGPSRQFGAVSDE